MTGYSVLWTFIFYEWNLLEPVLQHGIDTIGITVVLVEIVAAAENIFDTGCSVFCKIPK